MAFTPFSPRQPAASARLPLTLISLDDWALATLTGADAEKYLQGQVTADVSQMTEHQHLLARIATQRQNVEQPASVPPSGRLCLY
jgi:folate-binding Fe-S cluster repair protein YgfZ